MEKYLIINAGSSSLKFSLYEMPGNTEIVNGYFERIGKPDSFYTLKYGDKKDNITREFNTHTDAVNIMLEELINRNFVKDLSELIGVGHRVLHGGELYSESVIIDDRVLDDIKSLTKLNFCLTLLSSYDIMLIKYDTRRWLLEISRNSKKI